MEPLGSPPSGPRSPVQGRQGIRQVYCPGIEGLPHDGRLDPLPRQPKEVLLGRDATGDHQTPPDVAQKGVDGLEVCRYIKRDPLSGHTPVIFISAEDAPTKIQEAYDAGASGYLIKPIELGKLEAMLLEIIKS